VDLPAFKVKWSKVYGNPVCLQRIVCGRAMNDYVTLNSQMHSNELFTFVREKEARKERERGTLFQLHNKIIYICLGLTKVFVGLIVRFEMESVYLD
jgi:hypothetical protein